MAGLTMTVTMSPVTVGGLRLKNRRGIGALTLFEQISWCSVCNSRPADGMLTVLINDVPEDIPACEPCVLDPSKVEFV